MRRSLKILPLLLAPVLFLGCDQDRAAPATVAQSEEASPADGTGTRAKGEQGQETEAPRPMAAEPAADPAAAASAAPRADFEPDSLDASPMAKRPPTPSPAPMPQRPRAQEPNDPFGPGWRTTDLDGKPQRSRGNASDEKKRTAKPRPSPKAQAGKPAMPTTPRKLARENKKDQRATGGLLAERRVPRNMYFRHYGVNPTIDTAEEAKSTFAVDVDTAAYTMTRSFLERGVMPNEAAVRVEELVNAFDYGYKSPSDGRTFSIHAEAAPSPNRAGYHVMHVGIKGKAVPKAARKNAILTFVVDVSGSMDQENRLGLVKKSLRLLVNQLDEADKVGIVTYGSNAKEILQPTSAYNKTRILAAINGLSTEGATNAEAGLRVGYNMASRHFKKGSVNRVILCSDGVANVGITGSGGILSTVQSKVAQGITMTTIGVGMGNYNDVLMEQLANKGNGNYFYVDKLGEARRVFEKQLTGTLQTIAKDVKIQVDFDKSAVARYRLIGYENRGLTSRQFNNDSVDAGEVGAGHSVTAIYEVKLRPGTQSLGKIRIRYKQPSGSVSQLIEQPIVRRVVRNSDDALSSPTQLSLVAAQLGEKLRGSYWARNVSYDDILARFNRIQAPLRQRADVVELRGLVNKAKALDSRGDKFENTAGPIAHMGFDSVPVLR